MEKTKHNKPTSLADPCLPDYMYICDNLPEDEMRQFVAMSGQNFNSDEAAISCHMASGPKWVMLDDDGRPLAVGGYAPVRQGVWQSWMLVPESSWESHGTEITEHVNTVRKQMQKQGHRLQTLVLSDRAKARAWYGRIGLEHEGTLRAYGANKEDFDMYSTMSTDDEVIQRV